MDQLNRGVKVEGLMLPPGITLTRVDPTSAEGLRAKKEAISRVSKVITKSRHTLRKCTTMITTYNAFDVNYISINIHAIH